jgi:hypothetical protein
VSAGLFDAPVLDCYKDDEKSIGAAVEWACVDRGIFGGETVQRSDLLALASLRHRVKNDNQTNPEHETLGRELRHRKERMVNGENRQRMHFADRALAQGWRIVCEKGRVWAVRV